MIGSGFVCVRVHARVYIRPEEAAILLVAVSVCAWVRVSCSSGERVHGAHCWAMAGLQGGAAVCEQDRAGPGEGWSQSRAWPQQQVGPGLPQRQPGFNCPWRGWGSGELSAASESHHWAPCPTCRPASFSATGSRSSPSPSFPPPPLPARLPAPSFSRPPLPLGSVSDPLSTSSPSSLQLPDCLETPPRPHTFRSPSRDKRGSRNRTLLPEDPLLQKMTSCGSPAPHVDYSHAHLPLWPGVEPETQHFQQTLRLVLGWSEVHTGQEEDQRLQRPALCQVAFLKDFVSSPLILSGWLA